MLNIWHHPKTGKTRYYFSWATVQKALDAVDFALAENEIKAWLEGYGEKIIYHVVVKKEASSDPHLIRELKEQLQKQIEEAGNPSWDELASLVENIDKDTEKKEPAQPAHTPQNTDTDEAVTLIRNKNRAKEAYKLNVASIKCETPVTIEVDPRETRLIPELLEGHEKVTVKRADLELADYRVTDSSGNELLIERMRCTNTTGKTDFETSIQESSKIFDQAERLTFQLTNSDHQVVPVILLEGGAHANSTSLLIQQVDGALTFLTAVMRLSVLQSYNANHSAYVILKLAAHFINNQSTTKVHHAKPAGLFEQKRFTLESLPGVSTKIAEQLLEHFGSVQGVANACEGKLARVKGIGTKRAREIRRVLGEMKSAQP